MANSKEAPKIYGNKTYDVFNYEGGIGVYWMGGTHGTIIIAIPRLRLSTCLMGSDTDYNEVLTLLTRYSPLSRRLEEASTLARMIIQDIKG